MRITLRAVVFAMVLALGAGALAQGGGGFPPQKPTTNGPIIGR